MKRKFHPLYNQPNNPFMNKENIDPLLNNKFKNINNTKKAKSNFFDEMDQLLNADFWKKNNNKSNYPSNFNPSKIKESNNINNSLTPMNVFSLNNKNFEDLKENINLNNANINTIENNDKGGFNSLISKINNNIKKSMNLFKNSKNTMNKNFFSNINQPSAINNLTNNFQNMNNNYFLNNKNVNNYQQKNKINNSLDDLANLGTETKNKLLRLNNSNNNSILHLTNNNNNNKKIIELNNENINNKKEELNIINSQDLEAAFGSDMDSSLPSTKKKTEIKDEQNYFKQPKQILMKIFPLSSIINFPTLNKVQDECFDLLFKSDERALITSPTGSGKTLLFELSIARIIKQNYNISGNAYINKNFKIIYIAPIKSLCQEKTFEWKIKYSKNPLELNVTEYTSDSEYLNINLLNNSNIILTTPEKFDVLTRKWKDISSFISNISLLLIDEIHLLNEENRGATLEAIIARIKLLKNMENFKQTNLEKIRIIAVSATIPNILDVAEFLEVKENEKTHENKGLKIFGEEYRPVKVERIVIGYKRNKNQNEFVFEKYLDYRLSSIIEKYSEGKPTLIFCQTQKGTINSAKQLVNDYHEGKLLSMKVDIQTKKILNDISTSLNNKQLSNFVKFGIAFHNAGLSLNDRQIIEENFKLNAIKIICTTSTLSQGVNLPARLVIIKSTNCYKGHNIGYCEYNKMEIDQMCGRAGRPQFDNKGIAIIMTESYKKDKFERLSNEKIESHLKPNIVEHINAEIATGIIKDVETGLIWIKNTFMYIRMIKEPSKFGIKAQFKKPIGKVIDDYLRNLIQKTFKDLSESSLIEIKENKIVYPLKLCKKMSKNYVRFETMKIINTMMKEQNGRCIVGNQVIQQIIDILSKSEEFRNLRAKLEERKTLNELNKEPISEIRFKLKGAIDTGPKKAYLLIQSALSGKALENWELRKQQNEICQTSLRILNCMRQFYKDLDDCKGYLMTILMSKSLDKGMWPDSCYIIKQLPRIGDKFSRCLHRAGYTSFEKLREENNPRVIENICGKNPPFGNIILDAAKSLPIMNFKHEIDFYKDIYKIILDIKCQWNKTSSYTYLRNEINEYFDSYTTYHIIAVDNSGDNKIIFKKKIRPSQKPFKLFINGLKETQFPIAIFFISDKFIGLDKILIIENKNDNEGQIFSLYNGNLNNIINKINSCIVNKSGEKNTGEDGSNLSKNFMKEIEKQNILENEFDIHTSKIPSKIKSKSLSKHKKKKQKNGRKHKKNNSDLEIGEKLDISDNNINNIGEISDKTQLRITNFTTMKKNNKEEKIDNGKENIIKISKEYGENNNNSALKKINELVVKKEEKNKKEDKKKRMTTQNLLENLNNLDKNEEVYNFEFLNKYEKFDNETNSIFDLFNAPKQNNNKINDKNNNVGISLDKNQNNKIDNSENKSDLMFLNAIEDLNNLL